MGGNVQYIKLSAVFWGQHPPGEPMARNKSSTADAAAEATLQEALAAVLASGLNSKGQPILSLRSAAGIYLVKKTTLTAQYNG
jgi:hypothetical protein